MNYAYFCTTLHQSFIMHVLPFITCHVKLCQEKLILLHMTNFTTWVNYTQISTIIHHASCQHHVPITINWMGCLRSTLTHLSITQFSQLLYIIDYVCHLHILYSNSQLAMAMWLLLHFLDDYRRERESNEREYYVILRQEWNFRINKSNTQHNDLILLVVSLVDRVSLTKPRRNMDECIRAMTRI